MTTHNDQWWIKHDGQQKGPFVAAEIVRLLKANILHAGSFIRNNETAGWVTIQDSIFANEIIPVLEQVPPPVVNNKIVWWLAFAPVIGPFIEGVLLELFFPEPVVDPKRVDDFMTYSHYLLDTDFNTFWFVTVALNFYLCYRDEQQLKCSGCNSADLGSSFFVPVYLFKRAEYFRHSNAYAWVWLIFFVLYFF